MVQRLLTPVRNEVSILVIAAISILVVWHSCSPAYAAKFSSEGGAAEAAPVIEASMISINYGAAVGMNVLPKLPSSGNATTIAMSATMQPKSNGTWATGSTDTIASVSATYPSEFTIIRYLNNIRVQIRGTDSAFSYIDLSDALMGSPAAGSLHKLRVTYDAGVIEAWFDGVKINATQTNSGNRAVDFGAAGSSTFTSAPGTFDVKALCFDTALTRCPS